MKLGHITIHNLTLSSGSPELLQLLEGMRSIMNTMAQHEARLNAVLSELETLAVQIGLIIERNADQVSPGAEAAMTSLEARVATMKTAVADELARTGG